MAHELYTVQFQDGLRMYGIIEGISGLPYRVLFLTQEKALTWVHDGCEESVKPTNAVSNEECVVFDPDETWAFTTRASRTDLWLTGPGNSDQLLDEMTWADEYRR